MAAKNLASGTVLGKWKLGKRLGAGGQGEVWEVRLSSSAPAPPRALKVCFLTEPQARQRFEQEVRLLRALPNSLFVVPYVDSELGWVVEPKSGLACSYYVTERFECSLDRASWLHKSPLFALRIFVMICEAVEFLHTQPSPLVHRDIKPSNILLGSEPIRPVLGDLGIAQDTSSRSGITKTNEVVGSMYYRAPETLVGNSADFRSDVYSLGRTLEWMLTARDPSEFAPREIPSSSFSPAARAMLRTVLETACNADPTRRYQSVAQLRAALPDFHVDIAEKKSARQEVHEAVSFADGLDAYTRTKSILAASDQVSWREIEKRQRGKIQAAMGEWRVRRSQENPPASDPVAAADDMLAELATVIAPALARAEQPFSMLGDPLQVIRDLSSIAGWEHGGIAELAEAPRSAIFLAHHLLGAMAVSVKDPERVVAIARMPLPDPTRAALPLLRSNDVVSWPRLLRGEATFSWNYLVNLVKRFQWITDAFATEVDFEIAVSAYRWQLAFLEYVEAVRAERKGSPMAVYLDVSPPMFTSDMDAIRRGFTAAFPSRQALVSLCTHAEIAVSVVLEEWEERRELIKRHFSGSWRPWFDQDALFLRLP